MEQTPTNKIMFMLGEISSDIKAIRTSQGDMKLVIEDHSTKISIIEKAEVARTARASVFGIAGGILVSGVVEIIRKRLGF